MQSIDILKMWLITRHIAYLTSCSLLWRDGCTKSKYAKRIKTLMKAFKFVEKNPTTLLRFYRNSGEHAIETETLKPWPYLLCQHLWNINRNLAQRFEWLLKKTMGPPIDSWWQGKSRYLRTGQPWISCWNPMPLIPILQRQHHTQLA